MAHNLDITNGIVSFADARSDAWHQLGQQVGHAMTAEEAMRLGMLGGWNLRKAPLFAYAGDERIVVPAKYAVLRDNPVEDRADVLGVVGEPYKIIQNEAHADLLNALVDESGAHFETAGAIDGGRKVFITMKLPGYMKVGGVDRVDNYIAAINSHDGSMAFTFMVTPVRIVCENTLNMAFSNHSSTIRVRHTVGADNILIAQVREALDITFNYLDGFQEEAERLINTTMTQSQFEEIIAREFGAPEGAPLATQTRCENKVLAMAELFADADTHKEVRNTAWAGLNAITEWFDHFSPTRGDDRDGTRAVNAVMDNVFKNRALAMIRG